MAFHVFRRLDGRGRPRLAIQGAVHRHVDERVAASPARICRSRAFAAQRGVPSGGYARIPFARGIPGIRRSGSEMDSGIIDYENGTCNFDTPAFKELMDIAKRYPEKIKEEDYNISDFSELQKGELILTDLWITDTMNLQAYSKILGDKFNPIGIPGKDGSSFKTMPQDIFSIVANCKEKDGAWDFLKTFLEDSYQDSSNLWNGYPLKKEFFEKKMDASQGSSFGGGTIMADDITIEIDPPTQADLDIIKGVVSKATAAAVDDQNIQQIIEEEYSPYYNGKKNADEVAEIIQSRVSIYLAEKYR